MNHKKDRKVELFESKYHNFKIQVFTTRGTLTDGFERIPWCYQIYNKDTPYLKHYKRCKSKRSAIAKAQSFIRNIEKENKYVR